MASANPLTVRSWARHRLTAVVGGSARARVVVLLACVLALASADQATVGAIAKELQTSLRIDNTQLGLLASVSSIVGAIFTLPIGVLVDRVRRVRLLWLSVAAWAVAMAASALATSFLTLLLTRLALGAVIATAGPAVASLAGDLFPTRERGRLYGFVLAGELVGAGFGFLVSGLLAAAVSWRAAFLVLAVPALGLSFALARLLPEPARGGQSWLAPGQEEIHGLAELGDSAPPSRVDPASRGALAARLVREQQVPPEREQVLRTDLARLGMWRAARYVLTIRTNVILIIASALGYFFFAGLRTFAVVSVASHFRIGQAAASSLVVLVGAGALAGVLLGGRYADWLMRRGRIDARLLVAGVAYLATAAVFLPAMLTTSLLLAIPIFMLAAAFLGAPNPPVDAARLDIMPTRLWGRAEAIRTVLRTGAEAAAPIVFGFVADRLGSRTVGGGPTGVGGFSQGSHVSAGNGLTDTFLIMLVPLAASGVAILFARRYYARDVATAVATEKASVGSATQGPPPSS